MPPIKRPSSEAQPPHIYQHQSTTSQAIATDATPSFTPVPAPNGLAKLEQRSMPFLATIADPKAGWEVHAENYATNFTYALKDAKQSSLTPEQFKFAKEALDRDKKLGHISDEAHKNNLAELKRYIVYSDNISELQK